MMQPKPLKPLKSLGKKGLFYIYISSVLLLILIIVFFIYKEYKFTDRQKVMETRLIAVNDFLKDMEYDSKRVIYVSGFRSLIALEDYVSQRGQYLNDTEEIFRIAFYNGTVNGTAVDVLQNSSYSDYLGKLQEISRRIGIDVFVNVTNITLYHDSPWSVKVIISARILVNDTRGLANWDFAKNYTTSVPLTNIKDPLYSIGTYGKIPNPIRQTNVSDYVLSPSNNTENLQIHLNNSFYIENTKAPSFLMRLSGNFSPSPYGIESLVYLPELDTQGVEYDSDKSLVDYVFFTNLTGYALLACDVDNMPSWFKIDLNHTAEYEVDLLNFTQCS
ncbi:hypothetical protein JW826_05660 [Candidatus Woesearchaeota archaeon]|nr:hypothetical protein [Candidatus Woesearchaeota archaeon]